MSDKSNNSVECQPIYVEGIIADVHVINDTLTDNDPCCHTDPTLEHINTVPVIVNEVVENSTPIVNTTNDYSCQGNDDDGFTMHIRRRTKHYFVGGFKSSLTETSVQHYIKRIDSKIKVQPTKDCPKYI